MNSTQATGKIEKVKQELTSDFLKKMIIYHFSNEIEEEEIRQLLNDYTISIGQKEKEVVSPVSILHENIKTISKTGYSNNSYKTTSEKLRRDIRSVGMETFIKYFEYYNNPQYETGDIKDLFRHHENFSENSMASKASTGKGIIKRGLAREALEIIENANNIDPSLRLKAQEYLEKL